MAKILKPQKVNQNCSMWLVLAWGWYWVVLFAKKIFKDQKFFCSWNIPSNCCLMRRTKLFIFMNTQNYQNYSSSKFCELEKTSVKLSSVSSNKKNFAASFHRNFPRICHHILANISCIFHIFLECCRGSFFNTVNFLLIVASNNE